MKADGLGFLVWKWSWNMQVSHSSYGQILWLSNWSNNLNVLAEHNFFFLWTTDKIEWFREMPFLTCRCLGKFHCSLVVVSLSKVCLILITLSPSSCRTDIHTKQGCIEILLLVTQLKKCWPEFSITTHFLFTMQHLDWLISMLCLCNLVSTHCEYLESYTLIVQQCFY